MEGYLGEVIISKQGTEYQDYTPINWVLHWIEMYGYIDGAHHKQWLLDQIVKISLGAPVVIKVARRPYFGFLIGN